MLTRIVVWTTVLAAGLASDVFAQGYTRDGTVLGGLAGAGIGAAIGDNNDETAAGALIGGAIGAITGGMLGNSRDQRVFQEAAAVRQYQHYQQSRAVSRDDVVALAHNRLSDEVIISHIRAHGLQRPLEIADIVYLSQQGVSDRVIREMQQIGLPATAPVPSRVIAPPPVVVERYVAPPVYEVVRPRYYGHPRHCRNNSRFSVSFGR